MTLYGKQRQHLICLGRGLQTTPAWMSLQAQRYKPQQLLVPASERPRANTAGSRLSLSKHTAGRFRPTRVIACKVQHGHDEGTLVALLLARAHGSRANRHVEHPRLIKEEHAASLVKPASATETPQKEKLFYSLKRIGCRYAIRSVHKPA